MFVWICILRVGCFNSVGSVALLLIVYRWLGWCAGCWNFWWVSVVSVVVVVFCLGLVIGLIWVCLGVSSNDCFVVVVVDSVGWTLLVRFAFAGFVVVW